MPFDSLTDLKRQLGVSGTADDDTLIDLQQQAENFAHTFCNRTFGGGTFTEWFPAGRETLYLANVPIATVDAVHVDPEGLFPAATLRDPSTYQVLPDRGVIVSRTGPFIPGRPGFPIRLNDFVQAVRVTYTTPTDAIPGTVKRAVVELVGQWYRQRQTHVAVGQQNVLSRPDGTGFVTYPWGQSLGYAVPAGVLQLLQPHRVPRV